MRGVAQPSRGEIEALGDEAAQRGKVEDVRVFDAVAEGAGRGDERVLEAKPAHLDGEAGRGRYRFRHRASVEAVD